MEFLSLLPELDILLICGAFALLAGVVKGVVGFAMPMIMISFMGSFVTPELALAGLILPTLVTNGMQALRQGSGAAVKSIKRFRVFLICGAVFLIITAQLVRVLPDAVLFALIGAPVTIFALLQIRGWQPKMRNGQTPQIEAMVGSVAGAIGGVSGVWGPPTVAYLTALNTEKTEQMRVQGVIYGLGALVLTLAHLWSGVLRPASLTFSMALIVPAVIGMWLGGRVQDRIDQAAFRRATLIVLVFAGLNLLRRAIMG